jgi:hypothetical protein
MDIIVNAEVSATMEDETDMDFNDARSGRKRGRTTTSLQSKHSKSMDALHVVETENAFDLLSDNEETPQMPQLKPKPSPRQSVKETSSTSEPGQPPVMKQKRDRVPTITIKWAIPIVRSHLLRADIAPANFLLKQINGATVVKISNLVNYHTFVNRCVEQKFPFFTHELDIKKPLRIVLLGLPNMPVEEVKQALAEKGVFPEDIKPMTIKNFKLLEHNNFVLYFPKGSITIGKLREIRALESVIVKWVYFDSKRHGPTQCRRCQAWGHGSANCHLPPACVKCAGAHETSSCPISPRGVDVPKEQLKCVNCHQPHTANFHKCETRQSYIDSRPKRLQPKEYNRSRGGQPHYQRSSPQHQPHHWPQMSKIGQIINKPHQGPSYSQISNGINNVNINNQFRSSQPHCSNENPLSPEEAFLIFQEILPIVNSGKSRQEQILMIFKLATRYCSNSNGSP